MKKSNQLDQFYTRENVVDMIIDAIKKYIPNFSKNFFIEPSAGDGSFIKGLRSKNIKMTNILAYDIAPRDEKSIIKADYLAQKIKFSKNNIIIGNPPFGKRSKTAIEFVNKGLREGEFVCMILPNQFNRYLTQNKIVKNAKLIHSESLPKNSFVFNNKPYDVKCTFQIWTISDSYKKNLRLLKPEIRTHDDFETRIHNNTKITLKYFNKNEFKWDYAIHRQGFYNYSKLIKKSNSLIKNRQYFFIKVNNPIAHEIIQRIDFEKLSRTNTQIPGYSTTDFVKEYLSLREEGL